MSLEKNNNTDTNNYKNIVENLPVPVVIYTLEGKILYANPKAIEKEGIKGVDYRELNISDFVPPQVLNDLKERRKKILSGMELPLFELEKKNEKGESVYIEISSSPIVYEGIEAIQIIITDITARKLLQEEKIRTKIYEETNQTLKKEIDLRSQTEHKILNTQSHLSAIINTTDDIIFSIDKNYNISEFNNALQKVIKIRHGIDIKPGVYIFDVLPTEYHKEVKARYNTAFTGESVLATEIYNMEGNEHIYEAYYSPIKISGEVTGVAVFSKDVTEQKENQQEISNTQSQLAAIINNTTDIVVSIDKDYNIVQFNQLLFDMVKRRNGKELKKGMSVFETMDATHHEDIENIYKRVFKEGKSLVAVEIFTVAKERKLYFETNYNPIKQGSETVGIAIFSRDISEKILSETELRNTVKEKEVLLKEVHHRVKNNLQVISSILNLQTSYVKDKETADLLKECQNRIKTMAYIHESLYQTKDFLHINFSEYIINLVKNLFYSYDANQQKIKTIFDVDTIFLNLDTSIPCGLIVNELVSNALKYAFTNDSGGCVIIKIKKIKDNTIEMTIADNGVGMPENIDYKNTETLGLQLVSILSEQINGTITLSRTKGTTFKINF